MLGYDYNKIDFSKPVTRDTIDMNIYNRKFSLADKAFNCKSTPKKVLHALLQDKTIRIYLKFRLNGKRVKLYPFQDLIINDHHRFKYFRAANQIGKSEYIDDDSADDLTIDHGFGFNSAICSASLKQASFQMLRVKDRLNSASLFDWKEEKGDVDNMGMISYDIRDDKRSKGKDGKYPIKYTNRLIITPAGEGILGFDLHKIYPDEFEFWKDINLQWFVNQLAEPRTYGTYADTGIGNLCFTTNPNGADNYGAELEKLTMPDGTFKYHTYVFNFLDRPGNTLISLETAKVGKTRAEIESTLLAIRTLSDRSYFTPDEIERSEWKEENPLLRMVGEYPFFFLDVGPTHDQSCLVGGYVKLDEDYNHNKSIKDNVAHIELYVPIIHLYPVGYPISRVIGSYSERQDSDGWHYEKSVKEHLDEWSVEGIIPTLGCDVTGNSGLSPLFQTVNINPIDVTFSGPNKSGYWTRFKYMMEKGLIHVIKNNDWINQAKQVVATKSARGYILINSGTTGSKMSIKNKRIPDDCLDSTAGLIAIADPIGHSKPSINIVGNSGMNQDLKDLQEVANLRKKGIRIGI